MRKTLLRTAAATALACVLAAPRPARADWPTFDVITHTLLQQAQNAITTAVTNVEKAVTNIGTTIGNKITNLGTDLSSVLSNGFTQQANYAKAQVGAQQQIADASNTVNATFQKALRSASGTSPRSSMMVPPTSNTISRIGCFADNATGAAD